MRVLAMVLSSLVGAVACTTPATEVIVHLDTDAPASRRMTVSVTAFAMDGDDAGGMHSWVRGPDAGSFALPASFAVVPSPGQAHDSRVELVVAATIASDGMGPTLYFERRALFRFTPHVTTHLPIFLATSCGTFTTGCTGGDEDCTVSRLCEQIGETCGDVGDCVPVDITPSLDAGVVRPDATVADVPVVSDVVVDTAPPCPAGQTLCNDACVDLGSDLANCGACAIACPDRPLSTSVCSSGVCGHVCDPGYGNCDGDPANGCEASLSSATTCGACSTACTAAAPLCGLAADAGAGAFSCVNGCGALSRCGSSCVDTTTDATNCGSCGHACASRAHAITSCRGSACTFTCRAGFGDCDGAAPNGCEALLETDVAHCGACRNACAASQVCVSGACVCPVGETLCSGVCVDLHSDTNNCGMCMNVCAGDTCAYDGTCNSSAAKRSALEALVNAYHMAAGCPALAQDVRLATVAQHQAADMATQYYVGVTGADGSSVAMRAAAIGYPGHVGEIYEFGSVGAGAAMNVWTTNGAPYTTLMSDCTYQNFGIGYYYQSDNHSVRDDFDGVTDAQWHYYWVLDMGR